MKSKNLFVFLRGSGIIGLSFIVNASFAQSTEPNKKSVSSESLSKDSKQNAAQNADAVNKKVDSKLIVIAPNGDELMLLTPPTQAEPAGLKKESKDVHKEKDNTQPK